MEVHDGYTGLLFRDPVITMGVFDGVHLGHRMLLRRVTEEASLTGSDSVAVTFDPHPRIVLTGDPGHLSFLTDLEERIPILQETGIGHLVVIPFTAELSRMTAPAFVDSILCRHLGVRHLITGYNHHFGRKHEGDANTILECSARMDFRVTREEAYLINGEPVSSSLIRKTLGEGRIERATEMLGYDYFIRGKVVSGRKIGRNMGFPTANIAPLFAHKLIPRTGVYAVEAEIHGEEGRYAGMLNIGHRPTISDSDGNRTIEVHLISFSGDLYERQITVTFRHRLRDEMKFNDMDALAAQLVKDREMTIALLQH
ncbi:MAG: bifunctional riboflavin kinase/FAD synthetase [Bacteroidales bacterium]|jgi:riboflavin kinase/FMN adenylyltransferase|nr:bifunctional riboflavin kinase/FAD synthetase [Bacteroidales bacterium]